MIAPIVLAFILSGFAALTYELTWTKHLMLIFGVSHQAISTVLAAFMGGLALGSILLGRTADRARNPLRLYGFLELGIGASAAALPYTLSAVNAAYISLAQGAPAHSWLFAAVRFLLCLAVLLVPTTLMGGTLPAISRYFIRRREAVGLGAGLLYSANTLGGILGAGATGFILLRALGSHRTTVAAVALNLVAAAVALGLSLRVRSVEPAAEESRAIDEVGASGSKPWLPAFLLIAFGVAGATSLAYEVLWTRVLIYFMDLTIYSFTTILVTFLTGLALGSAIFAPLADRQRNLLATFGLMQLGIAASAAGMLHSMGKLLLLAESASRAVPGDPYLASLTGRFAAAFAFILLPTVLMGGTFPVITRLYARDLGTLGKSLGNLYGANTIGCVAGSLLAGFVLLQLVGAQQAVALVSVVSAALGVVSVLLSSMRRSRWIAAGATAVMAAGVALAWRVPPAVVYSDRAARGGYDLLFYREGPEASLAVLRSILGSREINLNGSSTAYNDYGDILSHKLLAHPPALIAQEPRRVLVIGLGMGSTAWSFAQYPVERIDCVELVPAEVESARFFLPENGGVLSDPRFHLIVGDGRNYLLTTSQRYDIISFNAIHPAFSPYLYTKEFYELCRSRLTEEGVICAWLPTNSTYFPSLLRTFQEVFPHCSLWYANAGHLALVGTPEAQRFDLARISQRMSRPAVTANLAETHLDDPVGLLTQCIMDEEAIRRYCADRKARLNTDDLPYIEFETLLDMKSGCIETVSSFLPYLSSPWEHIDVSRLPPSEREDLKRRFEECGEAARFMMTAQLSSAKGNAPEAFALVARAIETAPDDPRARYMQASMMAEPSADRLFSTPQAEANRLATIESVIAAELERSETGPGVAERYLSTLRLGAARLLLERGDIAGGMRYLDSVHRIEGDVPYAMALRERYGLREIASGRKPER